jgi:hypothetical protein
MGVEHAGKKTENERGLYQSAIKRFSSIECSGGVTGISDSFS